MTQWKISPKIGDAIIRDPKPGELVLEMHSEYYGGVCVAESMSTRDRDHILACVNAIGNLNPTMLGDLLDELEKVRADYVGPCDCRDSIELADVFSKLDYLKS